MGRMPGGIHRRQSFSAARSWLHRCILIYNANVRTSAFRSRRLSRWKLELGLCSCLREYEISAERHPPLGHKARNQIGTTGLEELHRFLGGNLPAAQILFQPEH